MDKIRVTKTFLPPYEEYIEEIKKLWDSSWITNMGTMHRSLENELKKYLDVSNISLFTNGHMALELMIQAMGLKGEIITTPYTFASTAHAIVRNGCKPVFCDIKESDYTIDETKVEELITEKTVAILPVHVYGHVCNNDVLEKIAQKYNLKLIYDAAHAFGVIENGRSVMGFGDASMLSFHATKVFHTIEGGAVAYSDPVLGEKLYGLKNFGIRNETTVDEIGANAKIDEFRCAMGLCNLKYVDNNIIKRKKVYNRYLELLGTIRGVKLYYVPENLKYNYAYFPIYFEPEIYGKEIRDNVYNYLMEYEIYARKYFYPLITDMDCYKDIYDSNYTPIAKRISENILTLPLYAELDLLKVDEISTLICNYLTMRG